MSIDPSERSLPDAPGSQFVSSDDRAASRPESGDWRRQVPPSTAGHVPGTGGVTDAATHLVDQAKETARATAKAISSQASELAGNIGSELTDTAEEQKSRGADAMRGLAQVAKSTANELEGQSPTVARYVRNAAESVEGLSETIRSRNISELVRTASDTARTHPTAFFVGAVAAGFALSRFFKSSSRPPLVDQAGGPADSVKPPLHRAVDDSREGVLGMGGRT